MTPPAREHPDYGIDAPGVVRNLFVTGCTGLLVAAAAALHILPAVLSFQPVTA